MLDIKYEDSEIIVVKKQAGIESQSGRTFAMDLYSEIRNYLSRNGGGPSPYVGVIHRLDRPVAGVMVYAKKQSAAASLSRQIQNGKMKKKYYALLCGVPNPPQGTRIDFLIHDKRTNITKLASEGEKDAKQAILNYAVINDCPIQELKDMEKEAQYKGIETCYVDIELITGRHHQIRAQFAALNTPLYFDTKYNPFMKEEKKRPAIGLCAYQLSFEHPKTKKKLIFQLKE